MTVKLFFNELKQLLLLEQDRLESFREWPFDENSSCSVRKMAEAGFYWAGNEVDKDTVSCFVCAKTLDGWEVTDDPWKEHGKHAPQCLFVKYGKSEENMTVEEFINIFNEVLKTKINRKLESKKQELRKLANKEINAFLVDPSFK